MYFIWFIRFNAFNKMYFLIVIKIVFVAYIGISDDLTITFVFY